MVLTEGNHKGQVCELACDESHTLTDLTEQISKLSGKSISYNHFPEAECAAILNIIRISDAFFDAIASWNVCASKVDLFDNSRQLLSFIGRTITSLAEALKAV